MADNYCSTATTSTSKNDTQANNIINNGERGVTTKKSHSQSRDGKSSRKRSRRRSSSSSRKLKRQHQHQQQQQQQQQEQEQENNNNTNKQHQDNDVTNPRESTDRRRSTQKSKQGLQQPLNGMVLSVSTFSGKSNDNDNDEDGSFHSVSAMCKGLGAVVTSQISKRVQLLICTHSAVKQATQRVRKAHKKNVPIVSIDWLKACKDQGKNIPYDDYLFGKELEDAINKHGKHSSKSNKEDKEEENENIHEASNPDVGWSEPKDLGCCCVCHENGSEKDCKWCVDCK